MRRKEEGAGFCPGEALARDCLSMLDVDAEAAINQWPPPMQLSITRPLTTPLLWTGARGARGEVVKRFKISLDNLSASLKRMEFLSYLTLN